MPDWLFWLTMVFRRFLEASWADRWLLFQTSLWLVTIKLGLKIFRFQTVREFLSRVSRQENPEIDPQQASLEKVVWAIERTSRNLPEAINCLPQALTAQVMLNRRGYQSEMIIGAKRNQDSQLQAHAWVEYQGNVIVGKIDDLSQFSPLQNGEVYNL